MGSASGKPGMQVAGAWYVTNTVGEQVRLLRVRLLRPSVEGKILVEHPGGGLFGGYPILPGATTNIRGDFWISPPVRELKEDFTTTVILTDQYANDYRIRKVVFSARSKTESERKGPPEEQIHSIQDPIEKKVVAVLKDEVNRYKQCGRRVGGLGSIQTKVGMRTEKGIVTELRESDSPRRQAIESDTKDVSISSDNAQTLLDICDSLTAEERTSFRSHLLNRLSKETEYAPVAYIILLVFFDMGHLPQVLSKAKDDLRGDDAHGFSDFLRLLDCLLRLMHPKFSAQLLDEVERFVENLDENTFHIPERLVAIRSSRLQTAYRKRKIDSLIGEIDKLESHNRGT